MLYVVIYAETRLNLPIVMTLSLAHAVHVLWTVATIISAAVIKNKDAIPIFQFASLIQSNQNKEVPAQLIANASTVRVLLVIWVKQLASTL